MEKTPWYPSHQIRVSNMVFIYVTSLLWLRNMLSQIMILTLTLSPAWPWRDGCRVEIWKTSIPGPLSEVLLFPFCDIATQHPSTEWLRPWKPGFPTHIFLYSVAEWRLFPQLSHCYGSAKKKKKKGEACNARSCFQRIFVTYVCDVPHVCHPWGECRKANWKMWA